MLKYEGRTKMSIIFVEYKNNIELYLEQNIWTLFSIISVLIRFLAPEKMTLSLIKANKTRQQIKLQKNQY